MINLRYHVASLIAVFLALGLGIVAGTTFVSPETVRALKNSFNALDSRDRTLQSQNNDLAQANTAVLRWAKASRDLLVQGKLHGRPAVLVSFDTTPGGEAAEMASTLVGAGAKLQGSFVLSSSLALADDASRQAAAAVVGSGVSSADALQAAIARQLADSLAGKTPGVLQRLMDAGLASPGPGVAGDAQQPPATLAVTGSAIVILAPGQPPAGARAAPDLGKAIIMPVVRNLSAVPVPVLVAVGEDGSSSLPVLGPIRQDASLRVVTADSADQPMGQAGIVLGLAAALTTNAWGSYGLGSGATAPLPSPQPSASPTGAK
ncbi:MAG TPA: copper transporter [Actinomycetota bacterium]|nr:copper transporter [Actinomycetota bacterium]